MWWVNFLPETYLAADEYLSILVHIISKAPPLPSKLWSLWQQEIGNGGWGGGEREAEQTKLWKKAQENDAPSPKQKTNTRTHTHTHTHKRCKTSKRSTRLSKLPKVILIKWKSTCCIIIVMTVISQWIVGTTVDILLPACVTGDWS